MTCFRCRAAFVLLAATCLAGSTCACFKRLVYRGSIPLLYIDQCQSNYALGLLVGSTFSNAIRARCRDSVALAKVQDYCATNWGRQLLLALKELHKEQYPAYWSELQGLAAGSSMPFDTIFMLNLRQEILSASETPEARARTEQRLRQWQASRQGQRQGQGQGWKAAEGAADGGAGEVGQGRAAGGRGAAVGGADGGGGSQQGPEWGTAAGAAHGGMSGTSGAGPGTDAGDGGLGTRAELWSAAQGGLDKRAGSGEGPGDNALSQGGQGNESRGEGGRGGPQGAGRGARYRRGSEEGEELRRRRRLFAPKVDATSDGVSGGGAIEPVGTAAAADVGQEETVEGGRGVRDAPLPDAVVDPGCSDVAVRLLDTTDPWATPRWLLGHNEDMTNDTLGRIYFLRASMPNRGSWLAMTYAGELASTAFGANSAGVAYTLNALYPKEAVLPGLGRNFMSRRLLDAGSVEEAKEVLGLPDQATGRSVNLMSTRPPYSIVNVQVGPGGTYDELQLTDNDWYFHANHYLRLPQVQRLDPSSQHRQARAADFAMPTTAGEVLDMLGDEGDPEWPIYRTGDNSGLVYTLCTVLYDLNEQSMIVYKGNPKDGVVGSIINLDTLMPKGWWAGAGQGAEGPGESGGSWEGHGEEVAVA